MRLKSSRQATVYYRCTMHGYAAWRNSTCCPLEQASADLKWQHHHKAIAGISLHIRLTWPPDMKHRTRTAMVSITDDEGMHSGCETTRRALQASLFYISSWPYENARLSMKLRSILVRNILASNPLLRSTPSQ